jgi:histidine kinase/DNA gyrase B/HSP90-like ATPase
LTLPLELGPEIIRSYRRLNYTAWHAMAEFVDNSTQSYFNNRVVLDEAYARETAERQGRGEEGAVCLEVSIIYDKSGRGKLRIVDTAMGMNLEELKQALRVAKPPINTVGRSKYGMGLKTAACWLGEVWTVRTKRLGDTTEHTIKVDVEKVASGQLELPHEIKSGRKPNEHYTIVEIEDLHVSLRGRRLGKVREFLASMYRADTREGHLLLTWDGYKLDFPPYDPTMFLSAPDGSRYFKEFDFTVAGKNVRGWGGVLQKGGRPKAGFSIMQANRVVMGVPDAWRPEEIYGPPPGSNDLVNQRLVGEIHLDEFDPSHTKDNIVWQGEQEADIENELQKIFVDYISAAKQPIKGAAPTLRNLTDLQVQAAIDDFEVELSSPAVANSVVRDEVPPPEVVEAGLRPLLDTVDPENPTFSAVVGEVKVKGFLASDLSVNDPYVALDATKDNEVIVVINRSHPHMNELDGDVGLRNYLRHCTYDAIAEWKARHRAGTIEPDTIRLLKDQLLRIRMQIT